MEFLLDQQQAYLEEQQAWARAWQIDATLQIVQHHDELTSEQAVLDAQQTEVHRHKATLGTERATTIDFTKARDRARAITTAINHEGTPCSCFARARQNVAATVVVLDTLPTPCTDEVSIVYRQLKDILGIDTEQ
jgi:hypothetical protein